MRSEEGSGEELQVRGMKKPVYDEPQKEEE